MWLSTYVSRIIHSNLINLTFVVEESQSDVADEDAKFIKFVSSLEETDLVKYNFVISSIYGKLLSTTLVTKQFEVMHSKIKNLNVYLDTNILIWLLWYHNEDINSFTSELFKILESLSSRLRVFDFTVSQLIATLNNYDPNKFISEFEVDTVHYYMKVQWVKKEDIEVIIYGIDQFLQKFNVTIDYSYGMERIEELDIEEVEMQRLKEIKWKSEIDLWLKHDYWAVKAIQKLRRDKKEQRPCFLEKTKYIFLTSDFKLCRRNWKILGDKNALPESIVWFNLATYLWFKNPTFWDGILLDQFVVSMSRKWVISEYVWERFLSALRKDIIAWKITQSDADTLLSAKTTKEQLLDIQNQSLPVDEHSFWDVISAENISKINLQYEEIKRQNNGFYVTNNELRVKSEDMAKQLSDVRRAVKNECEKVRSNRINFVVFILYLAIIAIMILFRRRVTIIYNHYSWLFRLIYYKMRMNRYLLTHSTWRK